MQRLMQFFKYPGSKHRIAKYYPKPLYQTIIEPFAGSAAYSTEYWWYQIYINDIDPNIAGLWKWLQQAIPNDIISIPVDMPINSLLTSHMSPYQAELCRRWQRVGRNTCLTVSKWNGNSGLWTERVKQHLVNQLINIQHWNITNQSYQSLPNTPSTWFVDPPYQNFKVYDYNTINYQELAEWCLSRRGQIIVCEQEGASWLPFKPFMEIVGQANSKKSGRKRSNEVVCEIIDGIIQ